MTGILVIGRPFVNIGILMAVATHAGHRDRTPFGVRLREARKRAGLTQRQVEQQIGVPQSTLADLEKNAHASGYVAQLAALYGCDALWLANGISSDNPTFPEYPSAGVPVAAEFSSSGYTVAFPHKREVAVQVRYDGKPEPSGAIALHQAAEGGVVGAAFSGPSTFAIRVIGDALHPAARHGSFIVCDPDAPLLPGEMVLLELVDGTTVIRDLVAARDTEVTTASVVGGVRDTRLAAEVRRIVPVVMVVSKGRWRST